MESPSRRESNESLVALIEGLRSKGAEFSIVGGSLRCRWPKGAIAPEEIERLSQCKDQVVAIVGNAPNGGQAALGQLRNPRRTPLSFSQMAHWHLYRLGEKTAIRQIAGAIRLRGPLDVGALRASVEKLIDLHGALRTRVVLCNGVPMQEVWDRDACDWQFEDLQKLTEDDRGTRVSEAIEKLILEPIDVNVGPLFGLRLLRVGRDEYVVIVAMEHLIADGVSLNMFWGQLFCVYAQMARRQEPSLPEVPLQLADYAILRRHEQQSWIEAHGESWEKRLGAMQRLRFPPDESVDSSTRSGWGTVPFVIGTDLTVELRIWCRQRQTTAALGVFTAYAALVLRWCNVPESIFQYASDCRLSPKVENTIGFFASILYLRINLGAGYSFVEMLSRVMEEYCTAYEHSDYCYMAAQARERGFTRNTGFNWIPQVTNGIDASTAVDGMLACSPVPFAHPMEKDLRFDHEPVILLYDRGSEIAGDFHFPLSRISTRTMERFGSNLLRFITRLLRDPHSAVSEIPIT